LKRALTPAEKARVELLCRIAEARTANALAADRARVDAERAKMAKLKALRQAHNQGGSEH
jgi:hypothetical protein